MKILIKIASKFKKAILISALFGVCYVNRSSADEYIPSFPEDVVMTADDITVANVILGEARGEGFSGMAIVADVLYERVFVHKRWKTPAEACKHKTWSKKRGKHLYAFEAYEIGYKHKKNDKNWYYALRLAKKVNAGIDILPHLKYTQFRAWKISKAPKWAVNIAYHKGHVLFNEPRDDV